VFTARYGLTPYIKQITFSLYKVILKCSIMQSEINTLGLCVVEERQVCKRCRTEQRALAVISWTCRAKVLVLYLGWDTDNPDCGFSWFYSFHLSKFSNISMIKSRLIPFISFPMLDSSLPLLFEFLCLRYPKLR